MKSKAVRCVPRFVPCLALGLALGCSDSGSSSSATSSPGSTNSAASNSAPSNSAAASTNPGTAATGSLAAAGASGTPSTGSPASTGSGSGGAAVPCPEGAIFCDDFEGFTAGAAPTGTWTPTQNNGTVQVDTMRSFSGQQSVHAFTQDTAATGITYKQAFIGLSKEPVIPLADNKFYGRMMFYLESVPTNTLHWTIIDGNGPIAGQTYTSVYRYGGQRPVTDASGAFQGSELMANYDTLGFYATPPNGPQTDCAKHANKEVIPVGEWACAEWFFDGTNNQMRFWLNGAELTDLAVDGAAQENGCVGGQPASYVWAGPTFSKLDVGWESYAADEARSIWIDDVVISSQQVGCPAR